MSDPSTDWIRKELTSHMQPEKEAEIVQEEEYHSLSFQGKLMYIAGTILAMILAKVAYSFIVG